MILKSRMKKYSILKKKNMEVGHLTRVTQTQDVDEDVDGAGAGAGAGDWDGMKLPRLTMRERQHARRPQSTAS
jgi:hypothetical protein